jgi:hypothetical protein
MHPFVNYDYGMAKSNAGLSGIRQTLQTLQTPQRLRRQEDLFVGRWLPSK